MALCHCLQHPRVLVPGLRIEVDYHVGRNLVGSLPRGLHRQSAASSRSIFFFKGIAGHRLHMDIRAELPGIKGQMASTAKGNNILD
jgi:hypothetical protein